MKQVKKFKKQLPIIDTLADIITGLLIVAGAVLALKETLLIGAGCLTAATLIWVIKSIVIGNAYTHIQVAENTSLNQHPNQPKP